MTINIVSAFGAEFAVLLCLPALGGPARHALAAEGVALLHLHTVGGQAARAQPQGLNQLATTTQATCLLTIPPTIVAEVTVEIFRNCLLLLPPPSCNISRANIRHKVVDDEDENQGRDGTSKVLHSAVFLL